jgi:aspartate carbamoyltransferase catalytic subunit
MSRLSFRHLLDSDQIAQSDIELLISMAEQYRKDGFEVSKIKSGVAGKILATLFFESSTRTRMSFESAMLRLGGQVITIENGSSSSTKKGETLCDTGRIVSNYSDVIVSRHSEIGSIKELATYATVPVINAGDGANQHPTQSLVDIYAIYCEKKRMDNLNIGIVGDLKYSRTVYSLLSLMKYYPNNRFTLISHPNLALDPIKKDILKKQGFDIKETSDLKAIIPDLDVLYVTRVQQERFDNKEEFEKIKNYYCITKEVLKDAKKDLTILHPLPRITEIDTTVDDLPQAKYFEQANYAVYIRMALLSLMLNAS